MQIGLVRTSKGWMVAIRPKTSQSMIALPQTFKTPWGALWASRTYWRADD